jgi:cytochrome P450 family 135
MSAKLTFISRPSSAAELPPGPRMPGALQAIAWARRPLGFLERCRERYGDIFTLRVRHTGTWVILSDPEDVKRVFTADHAILGVGLANSVLGPLLGPRSVMLLEEPEHIRRRKLMLPPFHGQRMKGYSDMMDEVTRDEGARWPLGTPFELWPRMREITLEVIMRVTFGPVDTGSLEHLREVLRRLTNWMNDPRRLTLLAAAGPRWLAGNTNYREMMGPVEDAVLEEVRRRRRESPTGDAPGRPGEAPERADDIASMLAEARYEDGAPMTEQDLRDELVTLLTDGPTSTLLSWVFERILRHPDKLARLRDEVVAGEDDAYLDAVVKETMRLCPGAPIVVRRLLEPMELGGYTIPAGATVAPCVHLVHRREDIYPEPREFIPERFLDRPAGTYTWIPFGGGVRRCIAASYAQVLMKRVITTTLREVDLRPADPRSERPVRNAIAFVPHRHALVIATRRTPGATPAPPAALTTS